MTIKMAINSQLSTTESKKQTEQSSRTETESYIRRSFGGLSAERGTGEMEEKVQGLRSINGRYRRDRERLGTI